MQCKIKLGQGTCKHNNPYIGLQPESIDARNEVIDISFVTLAVQGGGDFMVYR